MCLYDSQLIFPVFFLALYIFLEAADVGLDIMTPWIAKSEEEYRAIGKLSRPGLDGNELWLILGLVLTGAAMGKGAGLPGYFYAVGALVVLGALLRLGACYLSFGRNMSRLVSVISLLNWVAVSLFFFSLSEEDGNLFTVTGLCGALWLSLMAIQIGASYGAVKVKNPLAERWRATSLVTSPVSMAFFLAWVVIEIISLGDMVPDRNPLWVMAGIPVVFSVTAFALIRLRLVGRGLLGQGILFATELAPTVLILTIYGLMNNNLDGESLANVMDMIPIETVAMGTAVWTAVSLVWKVFRRKVDYVWSDHI